MSTSLFRLNGFLENLRIETSGPSTPIGRTATLTREPSSRRASQSGCDSSTRRPTAETILLMMRSRCASSLKRQATGSSRPWRSTKVNSWPLIRMSLMVGSLSSGSSGPRPVISSRISETNSLSSWVLSASRSTTMYCVTSCWMCARISSSGSFSSAERLISSISRRCRRTLASSSLSDSSGLDGSAGSLSCASSGAVAIQDIGAGASGGASATGAGSGAVLRRAVKRPLMRFSPARSRACRQARPRARPPWRSAAASAS